MGLEVVFRAVVVRIPRATCVVVACANACSSGCSGARGEACPGLFSRCAPMWCVTSSAVGCRLSAVDDVGDVRWSVCVPPSRPPPLPRCRPSARSCACHMSLRLAHRCVGCVCRCVRPFVCCRVSVVLSCSPLPAMLPCPLRVCVSWHGVVVSSPSLRPCWWLLVASCVPGHVRVAWRRGVAGPSRRDVGSVSSVVSWVMVFPPVRCPCRLPVVGDGTCHVMSDVACQFVLLLFPFPMRGVVTAFGCGVMWCSPALACVGVRVAGSCPDGVDVVLSASRCVCLFVWCHMCFGARCVPVPLESCRGRCGCPCPAPSALLSVWCCCRNASCVVMTCRPQVACGCGMWRRSVGWRWASSLSYACHVMRRVSCRVSCLCPCFVRLSRRDGVRVARSSFLAPHGNSDRKSTRLNSSH